MTRQHTRIEWVPLILKDRRLDWRPFSRETNLPQYPLIEGILWELQQPHGSTYYKRARQQLLPGIFKKHEKELRKQA